MRTNVKEKKPAVYTHEGAVAARITPEQQLRRLVLTNMLFEDQYYISGVDSAKAIEDAVGEVLKKKNGPQIVSDLAYETRTEGKLRHAPLFLVLSLVRHGQKDTKLGEECRSVIAETLQRVIQRPDELAEFVSLYWKDKKQPLSNQVKKGLASAFRKFNEYSLSKYANREGKVSLRDVLFLSHAKPENSEQADLWKRLANKELKAPENTWEVALSAAKNATQTEKKNIWEGLLRENSLGALALLRNLRNCQQAGVPDSLLREALGKMKTERVLPFRFISAAKYAPQLEPELEAAMFSCLERFDKLLGKTTLLVDNSGSMYGSKISSRSELYRSDAACALAMLIREVCEQSEIIVFGSDAAKVRPRRGFALRDEIKGGPGGGTYTQKAKDLADSSGYDRLIIITDEQSHTQLTAPKKDAKAYLINVASYQNGIGYGPWIHIDGWSESVLDWIVENEKVMEEELV